MVVLAWENPAADIIAARIFVRAGSRWEKNHQAGLSNLVAAVLTKGTGNFPPLKLPIASSLLELASALMPQPITFCLA